MSTRVCEVITSFLNSNILSFIAGSITTAACTNWLNIQQEKRGWDNKLKLFTDAIIVDLKQSINLYEKLINHWQQKTIILYEYLAELKEYRSTYERYTEHVLQFSPTLRDKIIKYYSKTKWVIFCLESSQQRKDELFRIYQNNIKDLKKNQPAISEDSIKTLASDLTKDEDAEFGMLNVAISNYIANLIDFKKEAQFIIKQIKKRNHMDPI